MDKTVNSLTSWRFAITGNCVVTNNWNPSLNYSGTTNILYNFPAGDTVTYSPYSLGEWKLRIKRGESATTNLIGVKSRMRSYYGSISAQRSGSFGWKSVMGGDILAYSATLGTPSSVINTVALQKAQSKFLEHYIAIKNTWRGGNFLAEVTETLHMLRHPLKSFYSSVWSFSHTVKKIGKVYSKNPHKYAKELGDAWLAWSFGVKPLISDVNDASMALDGLVNGFTSETDPNAPRTPGKDMIPISSRGYVDTASDTVLPLSTPSPGPLWPVAFDFDKFVRGRESVRYKGAFKSAPLNDRFALQQFGFDVFDVVPAIWEAIPWSFFVDYLINAQEMIDSLRLWEVELGWCKRTVRNSVATTLQNVRPHTTPSAIDSVTVNGGRLYSLRVYVKREPVGLDEIVPSFHFKPWGQNITRLFNVSALLAQISDSKPKRPKVRVI